MSTDVFLSYSTIDAAITEKICAAIESRGVRCWMAPRDVQPGTSYAQSIIEAINNSPVMVVVLSKNSDQSEQVQREVERAGSRRGMALIPVRVENIRPSGHMEYFLSAQHWLDAFEPPLQPHFDRLAQTVVATLARKRGDKAPVPPIQVSAPARPQPQRSDSKMKSLVAAVASAAMVLTLTIGYLAYRHATYTPPEPPKQSDPLEKLGDFVEAEDWDEARKEANRFLADPKITKSSEYKRLVGKIDETDKARLNETLAKRLGEIETTARGLGSGLSAEQNASKTKDLIDRLHDFKPEELRRVKSSIADRVKSLDEQLATKLDNWNKQSKFDSELKNLAPTGGIEKLVAAVSDVRNRHAEVSNDTPIASIVEESSLWPGVAEWSNYFRKRGFNDRGLTPEAAGELIGAANKLMERYPIKNFREEYNGRFAHINAVSSRLVNFDGTMDRVQSLRAAWESKADYMRGIYVVRAKSGDYYTPVDLSNPFKGGATKINFAYISGFNGQTKNLTLQRSESESFSIAPHCELIEQLLNRFKNAERIRTTEWVPTFSDALQIVRRAQGVDPIVHLLIYEKVFVNGASGSVAIKQSFQSVEGAITQGKKVVIDGRWFLPKIGKPNDNAGNAIVQSERGKVQYALHNIPENLSDAANAALKVEQQLFSVPQFSFDYAGWLSGASSEWQIADKNPNLTSGSLYVLTKGADGGDAVLIEVGELRSGQPAWSANAKKFLVRWRPLFVKP